LIRQDLQAMNLDWDTPPHPAVEPPATASSVTLEIEPEPANHPTNDPGGK
jgi:hypothetical protein